jgi:cell division protein FtsQ
MIKRILNIVFFFLAIIGLFVSLAFSQRESDKIPCSDIRIEVDNISGNFFVTKNDVLEMIWSKGDSLKGKPISSIPIAVYERHISADPSVKRAEVYTKHNGVLAVKVYQREPILRIISSNGESFYLDKEGAVMPLSENYTARVPVASGSINEKQHIMQRYSVAEMSDSLKKRSCLDELFELSTFIRNDEFWKTQIQQIIVEPNNELTLVPTVGDHHILLGRTDKMEQKFKKLLLFYRNGLNVTGWDQYSHINLKYKDQVICTKKNS